MKWPPTTNESAPAGVKERWQPELDEVWGLNPFGGPMLRLVWMQREMIFHREKWILKYPCVHTKGKTTIVGYEPAKTIGVPRWGIEQWVGPGIACQDWGKHATEMRYDPKLGIFREVDVLGEVPSKGLYQDAFWVCAIHSTEIGQYNKKRMARCCLERLKQGKKCYGLIGQGNEDQGYREPDERDILHMALYKAALGNDPLAKYGYDEQPPRELIEQDIRDSLRKMKGDEEARTALFEDLVRQEAIPHAKRLLGEGHGMDLEHYHQLGSGVPQLMNVAKETVDVSHSE